MSANMTTKKLLQLYPTPWKIGENETKTRMMVFDGNKQPMVEIIPQRFCLEIAEFICRMVNIVDKIMKIAEQ